MPDISTQDLSGLPLPAQLEALMCSLAVLDALMSPEWQYRYFSFDKDWSPTQRMGSMRDGSGDELFAVFSEYGAVVLGRAHEFPKRDHLIDEACRMLPDKFVAQLGEPAFSVGACTFIIWATHTDTQWSSVARPADDGSRDLLRYYTPDPAVYRDWADDYHEKDLPIALIEDVYAHREFDMKRWAEVLGELSEDGLQKDMRQAGYPMIIRDFV